MKEKFSNATFAKFASVLVLVTIIASLGLLRGEVILFVITNETQVMAEKTRWYGHIESYGQVSELPKE